MVDRGMYTNAVKFYDFVELYRSLLVFNKINKVQTWHLD